MNWKEMRDTEIVFGSGRKKIIGRIAALCLSMMLLFAGSMPGAVYATEKTEYPADATEEDIQQEGYQEQEYSEAIEEAIDDDSVESASAREAQPEADTDKADDDNDISKNETGTENDAAGFLHVTLDANGGYFAEEWDDGLKEYVTGSEVLEKVIQAGEAVSTFPTFGSAENSDEMYVFAGWSLERNGDLITNGADLFYPNKDCSLFAVWKLKDVPWVSSGYELESTFEEAVSVGTQEENDCFESEGQIAATEETEAEENQSDDSVRTAAEDTEQTDGFEEAIEEDTEQTDGFEEAIEEGTEQPAGSEEAIEEDAEQIKEPEENFPEGLEQHGIIIDAVSEKPANSVVSQADTQENSAAIAGSESNSDKNSDETEETFIVDAEEETVSTPSTNSDYSYNIVTLDANGGTFPTAIWQARKDEDEQPDEDGEVYESYIRSISKTKIVLRKRQGSSKSCAVALLLSEDEEAPTISDTSKILVGWSLSRNGSPLYASPTYNRYYPEGDCTLYAVWGEKCTATFNANGRSFEEWDEESDEVYSIGSTWKRTVAKGYAMSYYLGRNTPKNMLDEGIWDFEGWSTSKTGKIIDIMDYVPSGNCTFYAIWSKPVTKITISQTTARIRKGESLKLKVTLQPSEATNKNVYWYTDDDDVARVYNEDGVVRAIGKGTTLITVIPEDGYGDIRATCRVTVYEPRSIAKATVTCPASKVYAGWALTPWPTVKLGSKTLKKGTDYSLSYKNNKTVGTATITITGKGEYTGTIRKNFRIVPKGTAISKLASGKKKLTVTWKKQISQTTGYQIQYSSRSDFKTQKTVYVTSNKTVSKVLSGLAKKHKYYVRIRTYKTVGGTKYFSAWSAAKAATTK